MWSRAAVVHDHAKLSVTFHATSHHQTITRLENVEERRHSRKGQCAHKEWGVKAFVAGLLFYLHGLLSNVDKIRTETVQEGIEQDVAGFVLQRR